MKVKHKKIKKFNLEMFFVCYAIGYAAFIFLNGMVALFDPSQVVYFNGEGFLTGFFILNLFIVVFCLLVTNAFFEKTVIIHEVGKK